MAIENVLGIAVVSGKGGSGKSVVALNLAIALGMQQRKTLLVDASGGDQASMSNVAPPDWGQRLSQAVPLPNCSHVDLCFCSFGRSSWDEELSLKNFLAKLSAAVDRYDCVVFDCPTGVKRTSLVLAGLAEEIILVSTPDPTAIAGCYLLTKTLHAEGMTDRCGILFNFVESPDEAASLKTRFDILTRGFLGCSLSDLGYVRRDPLLALSVLEQRPLLAEQKRSVATLDLIALAAKVMAAGCFSLQQQV